MPHLITIIITLYIALRVDWFYRQHTLQEQQPINLNTIRLRAELNIGSPEPAHCA